MKSGFSMVLVGLVAGSILAGSGLAQGKIQGYIGPDGKIVFTNLLETESAAPQTAAAASNPVSVENLMEGNPAIHALIASIAGNNGVDADLVRAVVKAESNFNRWAVSSKGALGLMQLIPETGARFGVRDFFDPQENIEGGVKYLRFLLEKFNGNLNLSLAAYNAGENLVERIGRIPEIPETQDYVRRVLAIYQKGPVSPGAPAVTVLAAPTPRSVQAPEVSKIVRTVDERGVVHYSNIEPHQ